MATGLLLSSGTVQGVDTGAHRVGRGMCSRNPVIQGSVSAHGPYMKGRLCPPGSREPGEGRGMARLRFTLQGWPRKPTLGEIAVLLCLL